MKKFIFCDLTLEPYQMSDQHIWLICQSYLCQNIAGQSRYTGKELALSLLKNNIDPTIMRLILIDFKECISHLEGSKWSKRKYAFELTWLKHRYYDKDADFIMNLFLNYYWKYASDYLWSEKLEEFILELQEKYPLVTLEQLRKIGQTVILDFGNHIAHQNDFDIDFTLGASLGAYQYYQEKQALGDLRRFLKTVDWYIQKLEIAKHLSGVDGINKLCKEVLEFYSDSEILGFTQNYRLAYEENDQKALERVTRYKRSFRRLDDEVTAFSYACARVEPEIANKLVLAKIKEMSHR